MIVNANLDFKIEFFFLHIKQNTFENILLKNKWSVIQNFDKIWGKKLN